MSMVRIYTKCPACHNDTLTINDDKHLLCTWINCPDPCLIDRVDSVLAEARKDAERLNAARLLPIGQRLRTQDSRCTANPMFCVQIKVRDVGFDASHADQRCWHDCGNEITIYDDDADFQEPDGDQWDEYGYVDRWETVMVAFTEAGCEEYLKLNGHNDRRRAHNGEVRIYVESFNRCPEMIDVRDALLQLPAIDAVRKENA